MAYITQSQVAFLKTKFLNEIGASKEPLALPVVENILAEYAKAFIGTAVKNAEKKRMTSTGKLQSDLEFRVNKNASRTSLQFFNVTGFAFDVTHGVKGFDGSHIIDFF